MLDGLHQEHINMARLLDVLREKLFAIRSEKPVRYHLLRDVLSYLSEVSDRQHHPKEDVIYDYYLKYRCQDPDMPTQLLEEHQRLIIAGAELRELVEMILMDAVIPLDQMAAKLEQFIVLQQRHLDYEEKEVFPLLRQSLTEDDWRHIEQSWHNSGAEDPLFGHQVAERYRDLFERLRHNHD